MAAVSARRLGSPVKRCEVRGYYAPFRTGSAFGPRVDRFDPDCSERSFVAGCHRAEFVRTSDSSDRTELELSRRSETPSIATGPPASASHRDAG